jgi:hypothetical protein
MSYKENGSREMNRTIDDPCAMQVRKSENNKKFKFVTTNHLDLLNAKSDLNFFGMTVKHHLFVPSEKVEDYSKLRNGESGGKLTNINVRHGFGQLPLPTLPSRYQQYHGDITIEDSMRNLLNVKKNSCNPREDTYYDRSFDLFDDKLGIETPDPTKSIVFGTRGGVSTRFLPRPPRK